MTEQPDIDTPEGRRWLLVARCSQVRLILELMAMHNDPADENQQSAQAMLEEGCDLISALACEHDWANEAGE